MEPDGDGRQLLTSQEVAPLLAAAVSRAGGDLLDWRLDHVDHQPGCSTTATYRAEVRWPFGVRAELLGCSARSGGLAPDERAGQVFVKAGREVATWLHPADPDLPGLARAAYPERMSELLTGLGLVSGPLSGADVELRMVAYRPRRRAVLQARAAGRCFYVKVLREAIFDDVLHRHELLAASDLPAPQLLATTDDHLLVLAELPGTPLARAMFTDAEPCTAEQVVALLDGLPVELTGLARRTPWSDQLEHYARVVARSLPEQEARLEWLVDTIAGGLAGIPPGQEAVHGDFHEGQLHVAGGRTVGLLDVDTIGPGRRVDDLACLLAHLSTVQRMNAEQAARVQDLLARWIAVFGERVNRAELRLRAAAVAVSLATGPHRGQEPHWQRETVAILDAADALVRQAG